MRAFVGVFFLILFVSPAFAATEKKEQARLLVHLLEYIAADYPEAVDHGKVRNAAEYAEQREFVRKSRESLSELNDLKKDALLSHDLRGLERLILERASSDEVARSAHRLKSRVIEMAKLEVAPSTWPSRHRGRALFSKNCASCHGVNGHGDGTSGTHLDPRPTNFHSQKMSSVSPFQAFNTIRLGVPGTGMAGFPSFSDREVWDLAFYAVSLRYEDESLSDAERQKFKLEQSLSEVATQSDEKLLAGMVGDEKHKGKQLALLRLYVLQQDDSNSFLDLAKKHLKEALDLYRSGHPEQASRSALLAYLDGVEPVEPRLRAQDPKFVTDLELKMLEVRSAVDRKAERATVLERVNLAETALSKAESLLKKQTTSPRVTFSVASGIFLREAFEAVLLLIAILGVLRSVGSRRAMIFVHGGWIAAVALGGACWFFSGWVLGISGAQREFLEGAISLLAVAVLLYFGFWLHRKTEIGKWRAFINEMLESVTIGASLWGLAGISFMAVFREAFETVLFLRALLLEAPGQEGAVGAGVAFAFVLVLILSSALLRFSAKVPIRQLFDISSMVMIFLAFVLVGKAAHSFQETGILTITRVPFHATIDLIGWYPTYETIIPQILVAALAFSFWWLGKKTPTEQPV